eukprot:TRINITY_DN2868_c0_g1_i2.p1 TRINITY_DN2868_c0_g1~~TRINITY_DN2868_c0_g1_i2.p1  ORF type:complete len:273 (+),score=55.46 TRINITY_DN2868_c0_g1_i2:188-1006(+)
MAEWYARNVPFPLLLLLTNLHRILLSLAVCRICCDGGANRLYQSLQLDTSLLQQCIPDVICGDFDSLRDDVREFYRNAGATLVHDAGQDDNDFAKCFRHMRDQSLVQAIAGIADAQHVYVMGGLGGRLDHTLCNLSVAHQQIGLHVTFFSANNVTSVLAPGQHLIHVPAHLLEDSGTTILSSAAIASAEQQQAQQSTAGSAVAGVTLRSGRGLSCGVAPVASAAAVVSSQGLRWDMDKVQLSMRGMVSSSNEIVAQTVLLNCDEFVIWTVAL